VQLHQEAKPIRMAALPVTPAVPRADLSQLVAFLASQNPGWMDFGADDVDFASIQHKLPSEQECAVQADLPAVAALCEAIQAASRA
jgi:hypothetical protein